MYRNINLNEMIINIKNKTKKKMKNEKLYTYKLLFLIFQSFNEVVECRALLNLSHCVPFFFLYTFQRDRYLPIHQLFSL